MTTTSKRNRRPPTMVDVARIAGVTSMTVSRALREPERVAPRTLNRILQAIEKSGYVKNAVAGSLSSQSTRTIGVVVPVLSNSIFADTLQGLSATLSPLGYRLLIATSEYDLDQERQAIETLLERRVDAIALTGTTHNERSVTLLRRAGVPIVEMWNRPKTPLDCSVGFSNYEAARAMVRHLVSRGYRKIAYIGGLTKNNDRTQGRERGYRAGLIEADLPIHEKYIRRTSFEFENGAKALEDLLSSHPEIDVAFAASDVLAVGALLHSIRRGWKVPERIALAGLDGSKIGAQITPTLTSIRFPRFIIGQRAAQILIDRINGMPRETIEDVGFELVQGGSVR